MIARPHQLFADALRADYALGAFNTSNLEMAQAIVRGSEAQKSPVILQTSEGAAEYAGISVIASMVDTMARESNVPIVLHLDHGKSVDVIKECIAAGYTSVMFDASKEEFEENVARTREVVTYAHDHGVWVEAELGAIVGKEGIKDLEGGTTPESFMTDPEEAALFVKETRVDALAVSVGTIHGAFSGQEYIRFELLERVQKAVPNVPLVLHGASGISDDHLKRACAMRVCKVNVDTELRIAFEDAVESYFQKERDSYDPRKMLAPARDAAQRVVEQKIQLFGSSNMSVVY